MPIFTSSNRHEKCGASAANAIGVTRMPVSEMSDKIACAWIRDEGAADALLEKHKGEASKGDTALTPHPNPTNIAVAAFTTEDREMKPEMKKFYDLVEDIEICMMTSRSQDGHLRSRPMANQRRAGGADLWFVTTHGSNKLRDLEVDQHVNLSYYRDGSKEWVSVSGIATISRDRQKIQELYAPDWKMWFPDEGDSRHGTAEDPRMVLIGVTVHAAEFLEVDKPKPVVLYELVKGWITGTEPDLGEMHEVKRR